MRFVLKRIICVALIALFGGFVVRAQQADEKDLREAQTRARDAAKAFNEIMRNSDKAIPRELLDRAEAVAVFPGVLKAAFIFGGRGGEGLISRRTTDGWSAPAFFKLGGGSFGLQIGADKTDYIMLFVNDGALKGLLEDKFEIGADAGIAAGPIGREASAATNATLDGGIVSYSRSKGAFAGVALKGSRIAPNNEVNRAIYGKTAKEILSRDVDLPLPDTVKAFPTALSRYSTRRAANSNQTARTTRQRTADPNAAPAATTDEPNAIVIGSAPRENTVGGGGNINSNGSDNNGGGNNINNNGGNNINSGGGTNQNSIVNGNPTANNINDAANGTSAAASTNAANNSVYNVGRASARPSNRLAREIRSELLELPDYTVFDWLEFEILSDNTIVLRGFTTRPATKTSAENLTKNVEGVVAVRNEIEALPASPSDDDLRAALYRAVYSGQLFRFSTGAQQPIHIIVKNGRATLKGTVDTEADRNFANAQANNVSGVSSVANELTIENRDGNR